MKFNYSITVTKTIKMPNGNKQYNYVYLTHNPNFVQEKMANGNKLLIKNFKENQQIQFTDSDGYHIDTMRYPINISLDEYIKPIFKQKRKRTDSEMHEKYKHDYILDLEKRN